MHLRKNNICFNRLKILGVLAPPPPKNFFFFLRLGFLNFNTGWIYIKKKHIFLRLGVSAYRVNPFYRLFFFFFASTQPHPFSNTKNHIFALFLVFFLYRSFASTQEWKKKKREREKQTNKIKETKTIKKTRMEGKDANPGTNAQIPLTGWNRANKEIINPQYSNGIEKKTNDKCIELWKRNRRKQKQYERRWKLPIWIILKIFKQNTTCSQRCIKNSKIICNNDNPWEP